MRGLFLLAAAAPVAAVTPVQKVIELLVKLEAKVEEEGKAEAVGYDKYACFCKEQADNKQYAIERSEEKIKLLSARIEKLQTDIEEHNQVIAENEKNIDTTTKNSEDATATRAEERAKYEKKDAQYARAIKATERATAALQETGGSASFIQTSMAEAKKVVAAFASEVDSNSLEKLTQEPAAYNYHSSEIISVLQGLTKTFKQKKLNLFNAEANTKQTFNLEEQTRQHQIKVLSETVATNKAEAANKSAEEEDKTETRDQEENDKNADSAFLKDLTKQCESKAKLFDQRSQSRMAELKALSEGLALLKAEGGQNYTANKKLTAMAQTSSTDDSTDDDLSYLEDDESSDSSEEPVSDDLNAEDDLNTDDDNVSFIQTRSINERRVLKLLSQKAKSLKSTVLAALTVRLQKDHFAKVRALIKDLVTRLEEQAASEETAQSQCTENMNSAMKKRDDSQVAIEKLNGEISGLESKIATTQDEIANLQNEIAELNKSLAEQTELREAERLANKKTMADAQAGHDAVANAIDILNAYYGKDGSFIQQRSFLKQNPADRNNKTVGDLAPDFADEEYRGAGEESKGIVGILKVIKTDYQRTVDETQADEDTAQGAYDKFKGKTEADIKEKEDSVKKNRETLATAEDDLADAQDSLADETEKNSLAKEELQTLKASCVDTEISYEERVKRREQEIASLKEALAILEEMSFLQKRK